MIESLFFDLKRSDLISPAYVKEQQILHARPKGYGGKGDKWAEAVCGLARDFDANSILDYGCGQGRLLASVRPHVESVRLSEYDPAIPGKDRLPSFADLVTCTDVIEHIEPDRLDLVLRHLAVLARKAVFLVVATRPSNKSLSDGRNAHLIVESAEWWQERVERVMCLRASTGPPSPLLKPSREWVAVLTP